MIRRGLQTDLRELLRTVTQHCFRAAKAEVKECPENQTGKQLSQRKVMTGEAAGISAEDFLSR
jgi:hypothetical protein